MGSGTLKEMKSIDKIQSALVREYVGIKNGYIPDEARNKARKKRKKKQLKR